MDLLHEILKSQKKTCRFFAPPFNWKKSVHAWAVLNVQPCSAIYTLIQHDSPLSLMDLILTYFILNIDTYFLPQIKGLAMDSPDVHVIENTLLSTEGITDVVINGDLLKCWFDGTLCTPRHIHDVLSRLGMSSQLVPSNDLKVDHSLEINL